jgi:hypothetical protein
MRNRRAILADLILMISLIGCGSPTAPELPDGAIRVNGTVQYFNIEGGFWAVRGDDGVTYDPIAGLSPAFQRDNLRVTMIAKIRTDMGGIHMVGPLVEILSIETR